MVKHTVLIQIAGANQFWAEVEVDTDALDPDTPPLYLTGTFTRFDENETICKTEGASHVFSFGALLYSGS
jgi:hypothetical protein